MTPQPHHSHADAVQQVALRGVVCWLPPSARLSRFAFTSPARCRSHVQASAGARTATQSSRVVSGACDWPSDAACSNIRGHGSNAPPRSQCQASRRLPDRGSFNGLNCRRSKGIPTSSPYATRRSRFVETRWAILCPFHTCRCNQRPPSIAWIIPSRRLANSRNDAASLMISSIDDHHNAISTGRRAGLPLLREGGEAPFP